MAAVIAARTRLGTPSHPYKSGGYSHDTAPTASNPRWVAALPHTVEISQLSIPGTHSTMALHGGDSAHTCSLAPRGRLDAGIRCFHVANKSKLYHGTMNQFATLGGVLSKLQSFLTTKPG